MKNVKVVEKHTNFVAPLLQNFLARVSHSRVSEENHANYQEVDN